MKSIEDRYQIIGKIFDNNRSDYHELIENSDNAKSLLCLFSKVLEIELINESILQPQINFYNSQIFLRVLIEHYLVGYYIYLKMINDENDNVGIDFYDSYFKSEIIKRENYFMGLDKIKDPENQKKIEDYLEKYGIFNSFTASEINEIHIKAKQFDIRKISKYLTENFGKDNYLKDLHLMIFDFLEKYNFLSSFIHGGILAEVKTFNRETNNKNEQIKIKSENVDWGKILESNLKFYFLQLLFKKDPKKIIKLAEYF